MLGGGNSKDAGGNPTIYCRYQISKGSIAELLGNK